MYTNENAVGAVVGSAIGDSLGAGYEFGSPVPVQDVDMIGGGAFDWAPGEWTDDTQMSICVLTALAEGADVSTVDGTKAVARQFLSWFASDPPDVGNQTRSVLSAASAAGDLAKAAARYTSQHQNSAGNGSLMRTASIALRYINQRAECAASARNVSMLTHPDPLAVDACVLWTEAIRCAIATGTCDLRDGLDLLPSDHLSRWSQNIDEAESRRPGEFTASQGRANGFVVHAFQCAWSAIHHARNAALTGPALFDHAVRACVAAGDDADTTAAICGGLVGALTGVSAIPANWIAMLHGWPGVTYDSLMRLSLRVVGLSGAGEDVSWAHKARIGALKPSFRTALPSDPDVTLGNADTLLSLEDHVAVVSLCRIGREQVRPSHHLQVWLSDSSRNRYAHEVLSGVADQIHQWRQTGRHVFVHCAAGESRTPAAAAAYLERHRGLTPQAAYDEAHNAVGNVRGHDSPFASLFL
jgi:ADP-ribosyl-[dinitrogen reductase] hydrolase